MTATFSERFTGATTSPVITRTWVITPGAVL